MDHPECALADNSAAIAHPGAGSTFVHRQDPKPGAVLAGDGGKMADLGGAVRQVG
jgi:hypothetical protein